MRKHCRAFKELEGVLGGKIFISYRREDEPAEARSIRDRLAQVFGDDATFMDVDNVVAGAHFEKELDAALNDCVAFIAVIGPRWQEILEARRKDDVEDYVVAEISSALGRDILVIPTLVRNAAFPKSSDLPPSISGLAFRQAHTIRHDKFSTDVSELARTLKDKARIADAKPPVPRKYVYMAAVFVLVLFIAGGIYTFLPGSWTTDKAKVQVLMFTHDAGLTLEIAEKLRDDLAAPNIDFVINEHVDRRHPNAIYISESAPVDLVRHVIRRVNVGVTHIFPVDYATKSSVEMKGVSIALGLMADFEYYKENPAEKPYPIRQSQLYWLGEDGLDQSTFVERLRFVAPARKREQ